MSDTDAPNARGVPPVTVPRVEKTPEEIAAWVESARQAQDGLTPKHYYETRPPPAHAAAQRLYVAQDAELSRLRRAEGELAVHVARGRIALLQLQQHIGKSAPATWLRFLEDAFAAFRAIAPQTSHAARVRPLPRVGPRLQVVMPDRD